MNVYAFIAFPPIVKSSHRAMQHQPQYRMWLLPRSLSYHCRLDWLLLVSHFRLSKDPLKTFKKKSFLERERPILFLFVKLHSGKQGGAPLGESSVFLPASLKLKNAFLLHSFLAALIPNASTCRLPFRNKLLARLIAQPSRLRGHLRNYSRH